MKKNTFINGAFITTLGILLSKVLGIIYVSPFYGIIGEVGGALYGYAYTIYLLFMSISSAGIPLAISKLVSEYQALGYYNAKQRVFFLGKRIALLLGFICFLIIMFFAPLFASLILGDVVGGNTISDVSFVIRVIGIAILVVPVLSIYRGYFEGHRFMNPPSISQVIEQIVRVSIIIIGSYLSIKLFKFKIHMTVGVALLGATIGSFVSYLYLYIKKAKNKNKFQEKIIKVNEPIINDKIIIKKIFYYAIPFILIDVFKYFYNYVDMVSVVKNLVHYASFKVIDAESIYGMLSTWANKFNMIVVAISTGIMVSLIPNLTESIVKNQEKTANAKINQAFILLLYFTIPMTLGISFLSFPIWNLFYGYNVFGSSVLSYYIFVGFFSGLVNVGIIILQVLKDYRAVFISLVSGLILKILLNTKLLIYFYKINLPAYYGVITASILGFLLSFIVSILYLRIKYRISFEKLIKCFIEIMCGSIFMIIILFIMSIFLPLYSHNKVISFIIMAIYILVGSFVYLIYSYKTGLFKNVFGRNFIKKNKE